MSKIESPIDHPIPLPEAIANIRKLQKFFGQLFEAQPAIKSIDRVIEAALAIPQAVKDEAFEQLVNTMLARFADDNTNFNSAMAARAAVLSAHANAVAQVERAGMERAAKIANRFWHGSEIADAIKASII